MSKGKNDIPKTGDTGSYGLINEGNTTLKGIPQKTIPQKTIPQKTIPPKDIPK